MADGQFAAAGAGAAEVKELPADTRSNERSSRKSLDIELDPAFQRDPLAYRRNPGRERCFYLVPRLDALGYGELEIEVLLIESRPPCSPNWRAVLRSLKCRIS